ncbi:MAG: nitrous oxide reductase family maturation protein NosD [Candidatus Thorarchaeota archaeon]
MREKIAWIITIIFFMQLLVIGGLSRNTIDDTSAMNLKPNGVSLVSYEERGPLTINNDSHLLDLVSTYSWSGSGQEGTPYVIEGYNITSDWNCLVIGNVSLYFEVRDCYFDSVSATPYLSYGIIFQNVTHGTIVDSFITNKNHGIWLNASPSNAVQNCTIWECSGNGVDISISNYTIVDESTIADCGSSMMLSRSNFTQVMRSDIHGGMGGISIWYSGNCTVEDNTIYESTLGISNSGIYLYNTDNSSIVTNQIFGNVMNGIYNTQSHHNYIFDNHIYNNSNHGIDIMNSANITILQNDIHENGWWAIYPNMLCGIYLGSSEDIFIEENQIWNNTPSGISMSLDTFTNIIGNDIFNNTDHGVYGTVSDFISVIDNQIYGNGWDYVEPPGPSCGIRNEDGGYWNIESNDIWNNTNHGIFNMGDACNVTGNRIWDNNMTGIYIFECYDNLVEGNTVFDNLKGIGLITIGTNVTSNIVYDNDYGIYIEYTEDCFLYNNDIGWNNVNGFEHYSSIYGPSINNYWHDNESLGNWWHDYSGTGNFSIVNETGVYNYDLYPQKNMWLNSAPSIAFEISSTDNTLEFDAFALHPDSYQAFDNGTLFDSNDNWDGGPISLNVDGLSAGVHEISFKVYHVSIHSLSVYSYANVTDLTAPTWIIHPFDQVIDEGEFLSAQFNATDVSGIDSWWVNDTANFHIDSTGLLANNSALPSGDYGLRVYVNDSYGNIADWEIRIRVLFVEPTTTTSTTTTTTTSTTTGTSPTTGTGFPFDPGTLLVIVGAAGGAVVILIIVVFIRKRPG